MIGKLKNVTVKGICTVVPKNCVDNKDFTTTLSERELKKQIKVTGIRTRHLVVENQTSSDLCTLAAEKLLQQLAWDKNSIRALIYVTQTPDIDRPSTAFIIQRRLGLGKGCLVLDINLGCSGYIGGLISICSILQTCGGRGLLLVGDGDGTLQREGAGENLLMGDAGTATALEVAACSMEIPYSAYSDGAGYRVLMKEKNSPVKMNAPAVFSFAINEVTDCILQFKKENQLTEETIDFYVFHQAQKLIIDNIADICQLPYEKLLFSLEDYGNTVGASIPLTICHNKGKLEGRDSVRLLLCGYGIGLSWGCVYLEVEPESLMEIIESDYVYE